MIRDYVTMRDGVCLSVTLFLPAKQPAPCILEALPYRKDDMTSGWRPEYERFASEFGYAVARVDVRGTGSSLGAPAILECSALPMVASIPSSWLANGRRT